MRTMGGGDELVVTQPELVIQLISPVEGPLFSRLLSPPESKILSIGYSQLINMIITFSFDIGWIFLEVASTISGSVQLIFSPSLHPPIQNIQWTES